jgi:hypothetical protein
MKRFLNGLGSVFNASQKLLDKWFKSSKGSNINNESLEFFEMGEKLAECAQEQEISARGRISELFPYIYQASKRMSTRAISSFLADNFGLKLSAVGISRALKDEKKHWEWLAETVEPAAQIFARAHGVSAYGILDDENAFFGFSEQTPKVSGEEGFHEYRGAEDFLKRRWFSLDKDVRDSCMAFIPNEAGSESDEVEPDEQPAKKEAKARAK